MNSPDDNFARPLNEMPFSGEAVHRLKLAEAQAQIIRGFVIHSTAGTTVKFGEILKRHFELEQNDQRPRFLEAAKIAAREPAEVWENNFRHYFTSRGCGGWTRANWDLLSSRHGLARRATK